MEHTHIYYNTKIIEREDDSVKSQLSKSKSKYQQWLDLMKRLEDKIKEYEKEKSIIMKTIANSPSAIIRFIPFNDSFESYIKLKIKNEEMKPQSENKVKI